MNVDLKHRNAGRADDQARRVELATVFAALGDPTRLGILQAISLQDLSPDALAAELGISGNLLAHHLKVLQQAGLIHRNHSQHDRRRSYVQSRVDDWPWLADLLGERAELKAPRVVFVCTHNSARSQMAAAMWRDRTGGRASSAGTAPAERVHPSAVRVARRHGLDLSAAVPRRFDPDREKRATVITVCDRAHDELGRTSHDRLHWSIPDPSRTGDDDPFETAFQLLEERIDGVSTAANPFQLALQHHDNEGNMR